MEHVTFSVKFLPILNPTGGTDTNVHIFQSWIPVIEYIKNRALLPVLSQSTEERYTVPTVPVRTYLAYVSAVCRIPYSDAGR